jgi:hypothetical protein
VGNILTGDTLMGQVKKQPEYEVQIFNPKLNEGLLLAQDLVHPDTQDVMYKRGELLTVHVLIDLLTVGYEFIPCMNDGESDAN